jgi:hypothetical protein
MWNEMAAMAASCMQMATTVMQLVLGGDAPQASHAVLGQMLTLQQQVSSFVQGGTSDSGGTTPASSSSSMPPPPPHQHMPSFSMQRPPPSQPRSSSVMSAPGMTAPGMPAPGMPASSSSSTELSPQDVSNMFSTVLRDGLPDGLPDIKAEAGVASKREKKKNERQEQEVRECPDEHCVKKLRVEAMQAHVRKCRNSALPDHESKEGTGAHVDGTGWTFLTAPDGTRYCARRLGAKTMAERGCRRKYGHDTHLHCNTQKQQGCSPYPGCTCGAEAQVEARKVCMPCKCEAPPRPA